MRLVLRSEGSNGDAENNTSDVLWRGKQAITVLAQGGRAGEAGVAGGIVWLGCAICIFEPTRTRRNEVSPDDCAVHSTYILGQGAMRQLREMKMGGMATAASDSGGCTLPAPSPSSTVGLLRTDWTCQTQSPCVLSQHAGSRAHPPHGIVHPLTSHCNAITTIISFLLHPPSLITDSLSPERVRATLCTQPPAAHWGRYWSLHQAMHAFCTQLVLPCGCT
ncbi:hypothetical protein BDU57DRAFT_317861 [Ampelomyces quisqualis]|uniref:Uncharacterized protein n=1 Tax=Ampelomyces quisqualis TaxID=50730 RepID=A0A6A5QFQ4_AMPQU|nr:hypothetical protein BDU57DRAFT_317861 [Ampelomyces quisqualis]